MSFKDFLAGGRYIIFDGGMGTMLQAAGLEVGTLPEEWNLTHPDEVTAIHHAYVEAGSDVVSTNTFGANSLKQGRPVGDIIAAAVQCARASGAKYVAQDIGPTGQMLRPIGDFEFDEAYKLFKEQVVAGAAAGVDVFIIETMTDLLETKAAVLAVKENSDIPVIASLSYEKTGRTFLGTSAAAATVTLCGLGVDAVGVNCSLGPDELGDVVEQICTYATVPVIMQANAGLPKSVDGNTVYSMTPEHYAEAVGQIIGRCRNAGVDKIQILGGCCGTNPEFIRCLRRMITDSESMRLGPVKTQSDDFEDYTSHAIVCSSGMIVDYDNRTAVVGERLNPTGKKKVAAALRERNFDFLMGEAIGEYECGAQILDVNAGLPDIDEAATLRELVTVLQGACPLPLQIDTTDTGALNTAVRHYSGKPIINSVNGKEESMTSVFPIAAKYGAAVICLPLDENGIPLTASGRIEIAKRIIDRAAQYGIPRKDLIVDGLVMTASTNQKEVVEILKTVGRARAELGVHTCLGVSNISFGLPNREVMNAVFLAEAFTAGLNLPIIDPTKDRYMQTVYAHRVLCGEDVSAVNYIDYSTKHPLTAPAAGTSAVNVGTSGAATVAGAASARTSEGLNAAFGSKSIADIILSGNKGLIEAVTKEALKSKTAMDLINDDFIPALDRVGELYEKGDIFLPQLMSSAETAKKGFDVLKSSMPEDASAKRMSIVLATVKGDIHDIGKNIVRMLLENYGYDVIDLGKDVAPSEIVRVVKEKNIRLVGLSALMTTTVRSMEETICVLKRECPDCKIMVGGAVLTEELAHKIGADFYAKDAAESARIAGEF